MANEGVTLLRSGLFGRRRSCILCLNGIIWVFLEGERPQHVAERGDPDYMGLEVTPGGLQAPILAPEVSATTITLTGDPHDGLENGVYWIKWAYGSSRLGGGESFIASNMSPAVSVTTTGGQNSIAVADTGFQPSPDNDLAYMPNISHPSGIGDYADRVLIYRTPVNPAVVDGDDQSGVYYLAADVPLYSFYPFTNWTNGLAYAVGAYVTNTASGVSTRYRRTIAGTSRPTFDATELLSWFALGAAPVTLREADALISLPELEGSDLNGVTLGGWTAVVHKSRLYVSGFKDIILNCNVVTGFETVTISPVRHPENDSRFPQGILNTFMEPLILAGGRHRKYTVTGFTNAQSIYVYPPYEGPSTRDCRMRFGIPLGAIFFSETAGEGLAGFSKPDSMPFTNVMMIPSEDGLGVEALASAAGVIVAIKRNSFYTFTQPGVTPELVEKIGIRTFGNRGVATGNSGELFFITDIGINIWTGSGKSQRISDSHRNLWQPRADTTVSWDMRRIDESVLFYHPVLRCLVMIAYRAGGGQMALVWDQDNDAWSEYDLWEDQNGTKAAVDITAMTILESSGKQEVVIAGSIALDSGSDGTVDTRHIGREWIWESGTVDGVPTDKVSGADNHGRVYLKSFRALTGDSGDLVAVSHAEVFTKPVTGGKTYEAFIRYQDDTGGWQEDTHRLRGRISRSRECFSFRHRWARGAELVVSGTSYSDKDAPTIERAIETVRLSGKGDRR